MLFVFCENLAASGRIVSVIARDRGRLDQLADRAASHRGRINPVPVDYRDAPALAQVLETVAENHGRPVRTICWVHEETAPDAPLQIAGHVEGGFWQILGSAAGNPAQPQILDSWRERFHAMRPDLDYRQVALGFITQPGGASRWLTNAEISQGVETAIQNDKSLSIVGTIDPWSQRP
jgi:NAD(P)-dependent dehydrogenase (short-subunit alcohol dehydrogenase family)